VRDALAAPKPQEDLRPFSLLARFLALLRTQAAKRHRMRILAKMFSS